MTTVLKTEMIIEPFLSIECSEKQESTVKRYRYDLIQFYEWCQKEGIPFSEAYSPDTVDAYYLYLCKIKRYSILTIKRILSVLKQHSLFVNPSPKKVTPFDVYLQRDTIDHKKAAGDFLKTGQIKKLLKIIPGDYALTDHQLKYRHFYSERNQAIIHLMLFYGLTVQEISGLTMKDVHFQTGIIHLFSRKRKPRTITLQRNDRRLLHRYYQTVPMAVRPRWQTRDPFFASFDFQRGTYRWSYEDDAPKKLTDVSVQKMIRQEMRRAGLGPGFSGRALRNTYILHRLLDGAMPEELKEELAFATTQPIESFTRFIDEEKENLKDLTPLSHEKRQEILETYTFSKP
ncbi:tyrosine-type recombinase/integrase [Bacillus sp. H-16]|uniref:tyrosine-type recombinase/integrase n=1 Tax=Alteribacter salitolerans TaxID=2912333 RepID=UPI001963753E|nr:tyrosine-type recombinase/integrase [Alteribacter salitolerans]MBM7094265.1 tyrosine-type recombinase/integrase [Alteribacter salitolerans]